MYNELKENDIVWIKLPYGEFTFSETTPSVFIAGGTGVTPFISFLENIREKKITSSPVQLHYGVRFKKQLLYNDLIESCSKDIDTFSRFLYIENSGDCDLNDFIHGKIDIEKIYSMNSSADVFYYLSGPNEMIISFKNYLKKKGVNSSFIKTDEWM